MILRLHKLYQRYAQQLHYYYETGDDKYLMSYYN